MRNMGSLAVDVCIAVFKIASSEQSLIQFTLLWCDLHISGSTGRTAAQLPSITFERFQWILANSM